MLCILYLDFEVTSLVCPFRGWKNILGCTVFTLALVLAPCKYKKRRAVISPIFHPSSVIKSRLKLLLKKPMHIFVLLLDSNEATIVSEESNIHSFKLVYGKEKKNTLLRCTYYENHTFSAYNV